LTVVASATATTIVGGTAADTITGGNGADTITGGAGADTLVGGAGADTYVFAATGALNGADVFAANIVGGAGGDKLNFAAFLSGATLHSATATEFNGTADVDFANKVIFLASTDAGVAEVDTVGEVAALIQGAGNALALTAGGKGIVIAGDNSAATAGATIYFVNDLLDGVQGTVSATDVVAVGIATLDIDTLLSASNFVFS
jgi:Ca2+-binding RTX toxin-like protein